MANVSEKFPFSVLILSHSVAVVVGVVFIVVRLWTYVMLAAVCQYFSKLIELLWGYSLVFGCFNDYFAHLYATVHNEHNTSDADNCTQFHEWHVRNKSTAQIEPEGCTHIFTYAHSEYKRNRLFFPLWNQLKSMYKYTNIAIILLFSCQYSCGWCVCVCVLEFEL